MRDIRRVLRFFIPLKSQKALLSAAACCASPGQVIRCAIESAAAGHYYSTIVGDDKMSNFVYGRDDCAAENRKAALASRISAALNND